MSMIRPISDSSKPRDGSLPTVLSQEATEATRMLEQDAEATLRGDTVGESCLDKLGSYRIARRLGGGGMGVVYLAVDEGLERRAAVKVIRPEMAASRDMIDRLKLEAQAVARLSHPNIVSVYAFGTDRGLNYVAFEFIEGEDLAAVLARESRIEPLRALRLVRQAAEALQFALKNSVIHRDVKPANILVLKGDRVKVADFGLAKRLDSESNVTKTSSVVGSPSYMAPEQALGHPVDFRADIYALGCTLFTCLQGQPPYSADNPLGVLMKHASDPVPEPAALKTMIGGRVIDLLRRMMAKKPDDRFPSYEALIAAIDETIAAAEGRAPAPMRVAAPRTSARRRIAWIGAAAVGAMVVATGAYMVLAGGVTRRMDLSEDSLAPPVPVAADMPLPLANEPSIAGLDAVARLAILGRWEEARSELLRLRENSPPSGEQRRRLDAHLRVLQSVQAFEEGTLRRPLPQQPAKVDLPNGRALEVAAIDGEGIAFRGPGGREVRQAWVETSPVLRGAAVDRIAGAVAEGTPDPEVFARVVHSLLTRLPNVQERWNYFRRNPRDAAQQRDWEQLWQDWSRAADAAWIAASAAGEIREAPMLLRPLLGDRPRAARRQPQDAVAPQDE